jgi:hypothetical protein
MDRLKQLSRLPPRELAFSAAAMTAALSAFIWCIRDYHDFLALGPGGAPYNVMGWAIITMLRPFALSKRGARQVSSYPADGAHEDIRDLPKRVGLPASVGGIVPHRQLSQHPPEEMKQVQLASRCMKAKRMLTTFSVYHKPVQECCRPEQ